MFQLRCSFDNLSMARLSIFGLEANECVIRAGERHGWPIAATTLEGHRLVSSVAAVAGSFRRVGSAMFLYSEAM